MLFNQFNQFNLHVIISQKAFNVLLTVLLAFALLQTCIFYAIFSERLRKKLYFSLTGTLQSCLYLVKIFSLYAFANLSFAQICKFIQDVN